MKHRFWIMVFIIFAMIPIAYTTEVSGEVSGIWTTANSPYNVIGDLLVPAGQQLTINPGVQVIFHGNFGITVQGRITAVGTEADSIRFIASPGTAHWGTIHIEDATLLSEFEYCVLLNADTAISSVRSRMRILQSRIGFANRGINILGRDSEVDTRITFNFIHDITGSAIHITESVETNIWGNRITRCGLSPQSAGAIHIQTLSPDRHTRVNIYQNKISHNLKQGITVDGRVGVIIQSNLIEYNLTGVYLRHASGEIINNIVRHNYIQGDTNSGAGFMFSGDSTSPWVSYNTVTGNYIGFFITEDAAPRLDYGWGHNKIFDNIDPTGTDISIYLSNTTTDINARRNRFGSSDPEVIAASIYDSNDDPSLGTVVFEPFLTYGVVHGTITNLNPYTDYFIYTIGMVNINGSYAGGPSNGNFSISYNEFYQFYNPGLYIGYIFKENMDEVDGVALLGVHGGFDEPTIIKVEENSITTGVNIRLEEVDMIKNRIKYGESFVYQNREIIPYYEFHYYYKYRTQKLFLFEEGDYIYYYGESKANPETALWEDYFLDEPVPFMKVRNYARYDEWNSPLAERNIVRHVGEQVQIDMINNVDGIEMVFARSYFTPNVGLTMRKTYSIYHNNQFEDMMTLFSNPTFSNPESLMPLEANKEIIYEREAYNPDLMWGPRNLTVYDDGHLQWDPRKYVRMPPAISPVFRIYKNNQIYATVNYKQSYYEIDPAELIGSWFITHFSDFGESPPSNIVVYTSETDTPIIRPILSIMSYPNPVTISSGQSLNFEIKHAPDTRAKLEIFNIRGQKVAVVFDRLPENPDFTLNISNELLKDMNLASGIYFYRLEIGEEIVTRKMLILK